ncbi:MAG: serine/threonine protein kinase [Opitutales bacterium]|nr:serine/threonine protein kinase [Opitutales bacterium]
MNESSEKKLDEEFIFDEAQSISDPDERSRFLDEACGSDSALKAKIERFLESTGEIDAFFSDGEKLIQHSDEMRKVRDIADLSMSNDGDYCGEFAGIRIGRYNLIERIGDGGCGVVYLAEQRSPIRRIVAMKIVRIGKESRQVIDRFKLERQALAMMNHTNIARIFDAGKTKIGSPYFVMEYVRGMRITDFCEEKELGINDRLNLFISICHAIQHAHQKGIIHGDIKPANILVSQQDGAAIPKVIDFGIARATKPHLFDKSPFEGIEKPMGTPAYMSPEQMEMNGYDVDTRSDIYSLGILLYELLTGRTPFDSKEMMKMSPMEMEAFLRYEIPLLPSQALRSLKSSEISEIAFRRNTSPAELNHILEHDLDYIVQKATEKDRSLRYETANALAMDVQCYLQNEVILAHPKRWSYSFGKFIRRNKGAFVAYALVALALVMGMGASTWMFLRERDAKQHAIMAEQKEKHLREIAERREGMSQAALLISQQEYARADKLIEKFTFQGTSMDEAAVLRSLGEWHALNMRWDDAAELLQTLLKVNHFETEDVSTLDYLEVGAAMIMAGDFDKYEEFRRTAIKRFHETQGLYPDRFLKISLLLPADDEMLQSLRPISVITWENVEDAEEQGNYFEAAWRAMTVALFEYRRGNYGEALNICDKCLNYPVKNEPRDAAVYAIKALSLTMLRELDPAGESLAEAERLLQKERSRNVTDRGTPVHGFWFDWAFAKIIADEASRQLTDVNQTYSGY